MKPTIRRLLALVGAMSVLTFAAPPAGAATLHIEELRMVPGRIAATASTRAAASPAPCSDQAYKELGGTWQGGTYAWFFDSASTPKYLAKNSVRNVLKASFSNITGARNDCGMPDNVSATHSYLGTTSTRARCGQRDLQNVIGFKSLEFGVLAVTCFWMGNGRMVEADIQINSNESWALSLNGCVDAAMLEATMTHEAGHVFGLDHVGERRHGRLTMSSYLDGPCQNSEASLGRGDVLGLQALY